MSENQTEIAVLMPTGSARPLSGKSSFSFCQEKVTLSWAEPISYVTNLKISLPNSKNVSVLQHSITILHRAFFGQMNRPYSHFLFWLMSPEPRSAI